MDSPTRVRYCNLPPRGFIKMITLIADNKEIPVEWVEFYVKKH